MTMTPLMFWRLRRLKALNERPPSWRFEVWRPEVLSECLQFPRVQSSEDHGKKEHDNKRSLQKGTSTPTNQVPKKSEDQKFCWTSLVSKDLKFWRTNQERRLYLIKLWRPWWLKALMSVIIIKDLLIWRSSAQGSEDRSSDERLQHPMTWSSEDQDQKHVDSDSSIVNSNESEVKKKVQVVCKKYGGLSVRTKAVTSNCKSTAKSNLPLGKRQETLLSQRTPQRSLSYPLV